MAAKAVDTFAAGSGSRRNWPLISETAANALKAGGAIPWCRRQRESELNGRNRPFSSQILEFLNRKRTLFSSRCRPALEILGATGTLSERTRRLYPPAPYL